MTPLPISTASLVRRWVGAFLALATPLAAQAPATAPSPRVDSVFSSFDSRASPGCALAVVRDGAIIYERGYGMADLEHDVPITPQTVFDIGSTAKQFAAMSILLLARDGKLSVDDDIRRFIPELPVYGDTIRIRHLLTHTSGLRDYIGLLTMAGARYDDVTTEEDALAAIVRQKALNFSPGSRYLYSNSGFFLLSVIVKRASGSPLRDFARTRIFEPLGMTSTHYIASYDSIVRHRAIGYSPREGGEGFRSDMPRWLQTGDGGVSTTVRDLARWDANFYRPAVGDSAIMASFQTPMRLTSGEPITYAFGLRVDRYRGQRAVSHGGSWGGYRAEHIRFPAQRFSVITLCNVASSDPSALARRVADVYLGDVLAPLPEGAPRTARSPRAAPPRIPPARLAGTYRASESGETITIAVRGDSIALVLGRAYPLRLVADNELRLADNSDETRLLFDPGTNGRARRITLRVEGDPPAMYEAIEPVIPTAAQLADYAGMYFSEELQAPFTIAVADGTLEVRARNRPTIRLRPTVRDEFTSASGSIVLRFERAPTGVPAFTMGIGRVRGLRFERMR
jgi:CubicO group peptidase (beta-lactamase class C family)